ncbi:MAG: phosphorylase [Pseudopedobacter saltans]|uniref:Uridine phosphorylase n=1 Tax=Pseudopedobacter saltans TaxID=151895 RepID=A0A2W5EAM6_9SPHI|nr:MAG: phosphorylase [Pseudopedobacter saltans]
MSSRIAESELIINDRGAVYHLDIKPEELADTVITVGDPGRVSLISQHFDSIEFKNEHREFVSHTGYIGKKRLTVLSSGIGPDNIDIVMNELDALVNIDFSTREIKQDLTSLQIVRIGTSGALQADIPVDSFVAGTHGLGLDNVMSFYRHESNEQENELLSAFMSHTSLDNRLSPYISMSGPSLLKNFVDGYHQGITVTCPGFFGPQGRVLRLGLSYPSLIDQLTTFSYGPYRISNFEMETSAIYGLGKLLGHQCLSVNAIIANRISKTFTKNAAETMDKLIIKSLEILSQI